VFGTVHLPARAREPLRYGTAERVPAGYLQRLYHPFRRTEAAERALDVAKAGRLQEFYRWASHCPLPGFAR